MLQKHDLENEFPEYREKLPGVRAGNPQFREVEASYAALDKEILTAEENGLPITDEHFVALKRHRLELKERLEAMLKA